jgi:hypothetical protein
MGGVHPPGLGVDEVAVGAGVGVVVVVAQVVDRGGAQQGLGRGRHLGGFAHAGDQQVRLAAEVAHGAALVQAHQPAHGQGEIEHRPAQGFQVLADERAQGRNSSGGHLMSRAWAAPGRFRPRARARRAARGSSRPPGPPGAAARGRCRGPWPGAGSRRPAGRAGRCLRPAAARPGRAPGVHHHARPGVGARQQQGFVARLAGRGLRADEVGQVRRAGLVAPGEHGGAPPGLEGPVHDPVGERGLARAAPADVAHAHGQARGAMGAQGAAGVGAPAHAHQRGVEAARHAQQGERAFCRGMSWCMGVSGGGGRRPRGMRV